MRAPEDCGTLDAVRRQIDALDRDVVQTLAKRAAYVERAADFKASESAVRSPERVREALAQRRRWANEAGISPELVDTVFRAVIDHFVQEEVRRWRSDAT